jgi:hypothetical protein
MKITILKKLDTAFGESNVYAMYIEGISGLDKNYEHILITPRSKKDYPVITTLYMSNKVTHEQYADLVKLAVKAAENWEVTHKLSSEAKKTFYDLIEEL